MITPLDNEVDRYGSEDNWDSEEDDDLSPLDLLKDDSKPTLLLTPLKCEATPPVDATPTPEVVGGFPRESSGYTVDESISEGESDCSDMDYVEDAIIDYGSYVPSSPSRALRALCGRSEDVTRPLSGRSEDVTRPLSGRSDAVRAGTSDTFIVSPLSTSCFTADDFLSPNNSGPAPQLCTPEVGVASDDELSLSSEDEAVVKLLEAAANLGQPPVEVSGSMFTTIV